MQWLVRVEVKRGTGGLSQWETVDSHRCELPALETTIRALLNRATDTVVKCRPAGSQYDALIAVRVRVFPAHPQPSS